MRVETIEWIEPGKGGQPVLRLLDQTRLPAEVVCVDCTDAETVARSIEILRVRGAPAIGVAAAYGVALAARNSIGKADFQARVEGALDRLAGTRPTAVNLFWALRRMRETMTACPVRGPLDDERLAGELLATAHRIRKADREVCRRIGEHGADLLSDGDKVLTHCNAGSLATAGCGTALGIVYGAVQQGKRVRVFADETRPLLQGSRLTAWELMRNGIDVTVICDGAAAAVMRTEGISSVIVGADRVAANGDVANKIGTYGLAVLAREHGIPFCVAAPMSTVDFQLASGAEIPIEERSPEEVSGGPGAAGPPLGVEILNPAFDVTPHHLIDAIITEHGVARSSFDAALSTWNREHEEQLQRA
ncbi:MAG: S-methyl-5-thioribose-1-phosphate isomerase [Gemmatimonadetes bacterium]|nr:S-methyl-5-thioribose-1-phosphate isomerase [Gemmatimonadota bacterium]